MDTGTYELRQFGVSHVSREDDELERIELETESLPDSIARLRFCQSTSSRLKHCVRDVGEGVLGLGGIRMPEGEGFAARTFFLSVKRGREFVCVRHQLRNRSNIHDSRDSGSFHRKRKANPLVLQWDVVSKHGPVVVDADYEGLRPEKEVVAMNKCRVNQRRTDTAAISGTLIPE